MNKELEQLIDLALADGVLTDKEKQVLNKKAETLGVDKDEFEMVLEARLHLRQKVGTPQKQKDNVIKCPNCNDIIPALSRVCPSCEFVIDSSKKSSDSEKSLEDLISDIEDTLVEIKSVKQPNIFTTLFDNSYISLPILTIVVLVIGFRLQSPIGFLGLILAFLSWRSIKKKMKEGKSESNQTTFNNLKASFEKYSRTARTLFGENKKVKLLLEELNNELGVIDLKRKKGKTIESVFYGIIILITIGVFFIPQVKSSSEKESDLKNAESLLVIKVESFIKENKIEEANQVLPEIKSEENKVLIKSEIQLKELEGQLENIKKMIDEKNYQKAKEELSLLTWKKIGGMNDTEYNCIKSFTSQLKSTNKLLPKQYQSIEIEKLYWTSFL